MTTSPQDTPDGSAPTVHDPAPTGPADLDESTGPADLDEPTEPADSDEFREPDQLEELVEPEELVERGPDVRLGVLAGAVCVVVSVGLALGVDSRLDRQLPVRVGMLCLTLLCVAVLAVRRRRSTRMIGFTGLAVWGLLAPWTLTTSASPPEAEFAIAVHDDAKAAMTKTARSTISVADLTAAVTKRGGGVGKLTNGRITGGADAFPLVIRPDKAQPRPRICLTIEHGTNATIRRC